MERASKLEINEWRGSSTKVPSNSRKRFDWLSHAHIAFIGALALHGLAIQTMSLGTAKKSKPPEAESSSTSFSKLENPEPLELFVLRGGALSSQSIAIDVFSRPDSRDKMAEPMKISPPTFSSASLPLSEDEGQKDAGDEVEAQDKPRLFGIYTVQIQARIERVWRRPRSLINATNGARSSVASDLFQCQVQIVQDLHGNVQEVLLPNCNGSPAWQRSLVLAIQQASPLPAPPSKSVFTQSLVLNFVGVPFLPGSSDDEYELLPRNIVSASQ